MVDGRATEKSTTIDGIDLLFGLIPYGMTFLAATVWAPVCARVLRGEEANVPTHAPLVSGLVIASWTFVSGTRFRENIALRDSVADVRELVRVAASDGVQRDERNAARDERIYKLTVAMALLAGLTLAAAIATLVATTV